MLITFGKKIIKNIVSNSLNLTFDDITNADLLVGDSSNVSDWNTFFDLPTFGTEFTSVEIVDNEVRLFGGSDIIMRESLFSNNTNIIQFIDSIGSLTTAGDYCFSSCSSLTTVDLLSLTTAGNNCFFSCSSLTTIDLPSLTSAGDSCFSECSSLTTIDLPSLTTAGNNCFTGCSSLTTVDLPSLTSAGDSCFSECSSLTTVDLPSLTSAGDSCFSRTFLLQTIDISSCVNLGGSVGNDNVFSDITESRRSSNIYYFSDRPGNLGYWIGDGGNDMYDGGNYIFPDGNQIAYTHTQLNVDPSGGVPTSITAIDTFTYVASGTGASDGSYYYVNPSTTSGNGSDAQFDIVVSGGVVTSVVISDNGIRTGRNYALNDTITILGSQIGGVDGVDDLIITVTSLKGYFDINTSSVASSTAAAIDSFTYTATGTTAGDNIWTEVIGTTSGSGKYATFTIEVVAGAVNSIYVEKVGTLYNVNDTITILGSQIGGVDGADDIVITVTDVFNQFGSSASYFTNMYPGFFFMGAENTEVDQFLIDGELGADGNGFLDYYTFSQGGYQVYVKRVGGTGDPSVNHIIIVNPIDASSISQTVSSDTNDDYHELTGLSGAGVTKIYYLLFAKSNGFTLSNDEVSDIVSQFLTILNSSSDTNELLTNLNANYLNLTEQVVPIMPAVINLTVNPFLLTCNSGNPDSDIIELGVNNTLTVNGNLFIPFTGLTGSLTIEFNDIANADSLVGDGSDFNDWNSFFNLPSYSTPFTSVTINGNNITLDGGENIILRDNLFSYNSNILSVADTGCIGYLGDYCFSYCSSLTTVDLLSLTTAGESCFSGCSLLTTIDLPSLTTAGNNCFFSCSSLTTIDLPSLTTAGNYCFTGCSSLTTVDLLPSLTTAGDYCFSSCSSLTTIDLPSLTTAGDGCFSSCSSLTTVDLLSLTTAGGSCFSGCSLLTTVDLLPSLTTAGNYCFFSCSSLTTIDLPSLTTAGNYCFTGCSSLTTVDLLPSLTTAGNNCFTGCSSLTTIDLPSLTTAGNYCFTGCSSLTTVDLLPLLTTAGDYCFSSCSSLTTIDLPSLTSAGGSCFYNCSSLTTVDLPSCTNLGGTVENDYVFEGINGNTITATFNSALETNNGGNPDGDIQYLESNNTVTITYV
jgi:hypothetical protein